MDLTEAAPVAGVVAVLPSLLMSWVGSRGQMLLPASSCKSPASSKQHQTSTELCVLPANMRFRMSALTSFCKEYRMVDGAIRSEWLAAAKHGLNM